MILGGDIHDYNVSENLYQKPSGKRTTAGIWHPVQYRWNLLKCLPVYRKIFCRNVKRMRSTTCPMPVPLLLHLPDFFMQGKLRIRSTRSDMGGLNMCRDLL